MSRIFIMNTSCIQISVLKASKVCRVNLAYAYINLGTYGSF